MVTLTLPSDWFDGQLTNQSHQDLYKWHSSVHRRRSVQKREWHRGGHHHSNPRCDLTIKHSFSQPSSDFVTPHKETTHPLGVSGKENLPFRGTNLERNQGHWWTVICCDSLVELSEEEVREEDSAQQ